MTKERKLCMSQNSFKHFLLFSLKESVKIAVLWIWKWDIICRLQALDLSAAADDCILHPICSNQTYFERPYIKII